MMKRILLGLITYCLLLAAVTALAGSVEAQTKKELRKAQSVAAEGDKSFNKKDYPAAVTKYEEAIRLVPGFAYAHFWKGNAHYYLQQYDDALRELNSALDLGYTPLIDIYRMRWYVNYVKKNYDDALSDLQKGLALEPDDVTLKAGIGDVYYSRGAYAEAVAAFQDVIDQIPNKGNTYYNMAFSYYNLGQTADQKAAAQKAIQNGTQFMAEAHILIADAATKTRNFDEAADAYRKSLNLKQDIYAVYHNLSDIYRNKGDLAAAIEVTKKGLSQFPRDGSLYVDLSWYYSLSDMHDEAISAGLRAVAFVPDQYMAHTNLCRGYNDNKEYDKAIAACNNALRLSPTDGETNFYLGRAYEFQNKPETAAQYYKKAMAGLNEFVRQFPDSSDGFYLLGNACYANGLLNKAIEAYLKCLELSPRFAKGRLNLGLMYVKKGDLDAARAQYTALLGIDADRAERLKTAISEAGKP